MRYEERTPSADLAPYIQCIWELEGNGSALAEPIFPDGRIEVVVHLADRPRQQGNLDPQPRAMIVGQMLVATRLESTARMHAVGVRFTPSGARAWLGLPLHEITGRIEDAAAVCGIAAARLESSVRDAETADARFAATQSAIRNTLQRRRRSDHTIQFAIALIEGSGGTVTIDTVARACRLGPRQLERRFLEDVGVTPKAMARIVRFQRALRRLRGGASPAAVAAECGFADQPHLAREFRRFAGLPAREVDLEHVAFLQDGPAASPAHS